MCVHFHAGVCHWDSVLYLQQESELQERQVEEFVATNAYCWKVALSFAVPCDIQQNFLWMSVRGRVGRRNQVSVKEHSPKWVRAAHPLLWRAIGKGLGMQACPPKVQDKTPWNCQPLVPTFLSLLTYILPPSLLVGGQVTLAKHET